MHLPLSKRENLGIESNVDSLIVQFPVNVINSYGMTSCCTVTAANNKQLLTKESRKPMAQMCNLLPDFRSKL